MTAFFFISMFRSNTLFLVLSNLPLTNFCSTVFHWVWFQARTSTGGPCSPWATLWPARDSSTPPSSATLSLLWSSAAFLKSHRRLAYIFLFVLIIERILFMYRSRNARTKPLFCSIQIYMTGKHRVFLSSKGIVSRDCAHQKMILKGKRNILLQPSGIFIQFYS